MKKVLSGVVRVSVIPDGEMFVFYGSYHGSPLRAIFHKLAGVMYTYDAATTHWFTYASSTLNMDEELHWKAAIPGTDLMLLLYGIKTRDQN